ncbi:hypothetical protein FOMG_14152 [Fusarium oxysporum f. sp. melonis 26406]|nr:hypothetical protein FOMG_14152 [Fusarium oxysporum f. sp. melonis 26406]
MTTISNSDSLPSVFQAFTAEYPNIKVILPGDAEWTDITKSFIKTSSSPSIVARPQNASDVQDLVRFCVSHNIDFVVRSGGHNCTGRSQVNGALTFDMRNINYVNISEDKKTANIGGGIITRELAKALDAEELITTTPLSTKYGLGVDQIIGAKYANAGDVLVDAGGEKLTAIRGGGDCLGIIAEITFSF